MNEGSGQTVRDWSGRGNNGYLGSTTGADANDPSWIKGVFLGSALRFDGADDYVTIPDSDSLEPQRLTVAAWVKGSGTPDHRYIVGKGANACSTGSWGLYTGEGGGAAFYIADSPSMFYRSPEAPASAVWDGKWHHIAGTFDGSKVRFYLDGVQMGSGTTAATTIDYSLPIGGGQIGSYPGTCSPALTLTGDIDGVQVWSQALPVDSIWNALRSLFNLAK
jgi:concanavalin A-like lectin/glucanase superfamily protein